MKPLLINVPIEPIEMRYSIDWDIWFRDSFESEKHNFEVFTIYGCSTSGKINTGAFLDIFETNIYKASQLQKILQVISVQPIDRPIILFFHDIWFPGIEMIFYVKDGGNRPIFITGCLHAGSYDVHDFLAKKQMTSWALHLENAWLSKVDKVFLATEFHRNLICEKRIVEPHRLCVTGFPLFSCTQPPESDIPKEKIIIFPHRIHQEKNPELFDRVAQTLETAYPSWKFIKTAEICKTKTEYRLLLKKATIAVSTAYQETWGIAMQECVHSGCIPVCPDRLSYTEMYDSPFQYAGESRNFLYDGSYQDLLRTLSFFIENHTADKVVYNTKKLSKKLHQSSTNAIENIIIHLLNTTCQ